MDRQVKMGTVDEVRFTAKLSVKGKKAKWYMRNQVSIETNLETVDSKVYVQTKNSSTVSTNINDK